MGACPHEAAAGGERKPIAPPLATLLPSEKAWLVTLPFPPSAPAAMDDARVYIPLQGEHFIALDRQTGETLWTADIESEWTPLVSDGVVYIAASDELHALDAATGDRKWRVPLGRGPMAPPLITQDTIVTLVSPDEVWAFRTADGELRWKKDVKGAVGPASMALDHTQVFFALGSRLISLELSDGTVRWDRMLPGQLRAPALSRDRVFVGSTANAFYAVHKDSGTLSWSYPVGGDVIGATVDNDVVFVVSLDNVLRALKQSTGNQIWKRALNARPAGAPRAVGGVVAVSSISPPVATFNAKSGMAIASLDLSADVQGAKFVAPTLVASTMAPFKVSLVAITRDGRATGQRPVSMMFRDAALVPLAALPGKPLLKERPTP